MKFKPYQDIPRNQHEVLAQKQETELRPANAIELHNLVSHFRRNHGFTGLPADKKRFPGVER